MALRKRAEVLHYVFMRYRPRLPLSLNSLLFYTGTGDHYDVVRRTDTGKLLLLIAVFLLVQIKDRAVLIDGTDLYKVSLSDTLFFLIKIEDKNLSIDSVDLSKVSFRNPQDNHGL